ncbi:hypothetical protein GGR57DRAFT_505838 [Xylariaceae sp. FL1272]|nr:hypothetical protein GGR57DRAFT_505838 [Xylariaceae sp. FL1272]
MASHAKLTLTHYRNADRTAEEMMSWIVTHHLLLVIPVMKQYGVTAYSLEELTTADRDCFIEYTLTSVEQFMPPLEHPEWIKSPEGQENWNDSSRSMISGEVTPYLLESGDMVNVPVSS